MIHPATSTQNRCFFPDDRLLSAARCCLLSLDLKTWSIWRWTWSSISTTISATRQIARLVSLISPWTDDQIENGSKINLICKWTKIINVLRVIVRRTQWIRQRKCFMGLGFNFFYLTWSPLTTLAIFQTTKLWNSLICQLNYFQVILTSLSDV